LGETGGVKAKKTEQKRPGATRIFPSLGKPGEQSLGGKKVSPGSPQHRRGGCTTLEIKTKTGGAAPPERYFKRREKKGKKTSIKPYKNRSRCKT